MLPMLPGTGANALPPGTGATLMTPGTGAGAYAWQPGQEGRVFAPGVSGSSANPLWVDASGQIQSPWIGPHGEHTAMTFNNARNVHMSGVPGGPAFGGPGQQPTDLAGAVNRAYAPSLAQLLQGLPNAGGQ